MVNAGLLSKGTTLSYIENGNVKTIAGVRSIPTVGSDPEKVDVTSLGSSKKRYVKGLQDTDNLEFSVIYKGENFKDIHRLVELDKPLEWLVMYPDGMTVRFTGEVMQKIDGVEVNAAIGFSIVIVVSEGPSIEFAKEPSRPTALKASNVQFDQFNLSWNGSGLFRIYVDRNNVGETYNNTFTVTGLKPSTKHVVSVASASGINEVHAVPIEVTTTKLPKITKINVPQRLDLYVDETKQLDVSTVPIEAMRAYEHVNKAVLDNSIVKFDGDNVSGIKSVNDENLGRNLFKGSLDFSGNWDGKGSWINSGTYNNFTVLARSSLYNGLSQEISVVNEKTYTFSFYYKTDGNCEASVYIKHKQNDVSAEVDKWKYILEEVSDWKKEKVTFKVSKSGYVLPRVEMSNGNGKIYIFGFCLTETKDKHYWTPAPEDGYSYTNANVTFDDAEKSSAEFDIFVHERKRMTSPTESDTASFIL